MGYTLPWFSAHGVDDPTFLGTGYGAIQCLLCRGDRVFLTYETTGRGVEAIMGSLHLLDMTAKGSRYAIRAGRYGRREFWEDSPAGWPQCAPYSFWRRDGRPTGQWSRPGVTPVGSQTDHEGR